MIQCYCNKKNQNSTNALETSIFDQNPQNQQQQYQTSQFGNFQNNNFNQPNEDNSYFVTPQKPAWA